MAKKFVIQCPDCGRYVEAQTGLFAKKTVQCSCGRVIDTKKDKMTTKVCPHCGNEIMYDQSKGTDAVCPVCHKKINTEEDLYAFVHFTCPSCQGQQTANKNATTHTCTLCGEVIDVKKRLAQEELKKSGNASVIKWDASNDVFVYKHPIEDFTLGSQLIVHASQEAMFFRDGVALDVFGAGRYTLETNNIPHLNEIYKLAPESDIALHTEVYFINKVTQMGIKWGTPTKARILESKTGIPIEVGARGSFNIEVVDSRKLITRLVGTTSGFTQNEMLDGGVAYDMEYMRGKFADMIAMNVTSLLAKIIMENNLDVLTIDTKKPEISRILGGAVNNGLMEFGLQIPMGQFYVTDIVMPDDDPNYIRLKKQQAKNLDLRDEKIAVELEEAKRTRLFAEAETDAQLRIHEAATDVEILKASTQGFADSVIIDAKAQAEKIKLEGHALVDVYRDQSAAEAEALKAKGGDYKMETERIVGETMAENGVTIVNVNVEGQDKWTCSCGKTGITSNFCPDCGAKKLAPPTEWNCSCGAKGIKSKFCPECGAKRP